MGAQRMSDKKAKRWAVQLNLPIVRMWAFGGYTHAFVTADHRHGWVDTKTGEWEWDETGGENAIHFTSCSELFPKRPEGVTPAS